MGTGGMGERAIGAGMASAAPSDAPRSAPRNLYVREDHSLEALPHLLARTAGPVQEGVGEELVDQVREQRLQIHYGGEHLEIRPASLTLKPRNLSAAS
ncbi:hypothetical protein Lesp01_35530 [Lentzea sp. NBRC 102530]|nr:hypothetical protein Lesp01_35530 [Lentzea sp. NBRC 102530]